MVILVYDNSKSCVDTGHEIKFTMRMGILMVDISKSCVDAGTRWSPRWKKGILVVGNSPKFDWFIKQRIPTVSDNHVTNIIV